MKLQTIPLLLTSSIVASDVGVNLKSIDARLHHTYECIDEWLKIDPTIPIVICDGSDYDLSFSIGKKFPKANIETLHFQNTIEKINAYGRGFGEGEIVKYAILNSRVISSYKCFAKCTSKLWVDNFSECRTLWNDEFLCKGVFDNVFSPLHKIKLKHIDTRFYLAKTDFYKENLLNAHYFIDLESGFGLEECFKQVLSEKLDTIKMFKIQPIISGVGGGTGKYYKNTWVRIQKEKARLFVLRNTKKFAIYF